ncbi:NaeI family type II restriction endonuclease [Streptomyces sp. NPDC102381]|uniref:NaeI family type II restriction endonuclease n=1 Tax=Streptomyces sp. NPDC102381 TaxID=3366164 RepID=UPI0037FBE05B
MNLPTSVPRGSYDDDELVAVREALYAVDPTGENMAAVVRGTYDQLLDGRRMGRWDYRDLHKTEKTYMGTLIEINIYKEFELQEGEVADYLIEGIEVDCKYAKAVGGWEIGPELVGCVCLVVTASDLLNTWRAGLVRASEQHLRFSENRDQKRKLNSTGVASIDWLWGGLRELAPNQLLHMDPTKRSQIMAAQGPTGRNTGQARINMLFSEMQQVVIRRVTVETVGYGLDDPLKRARSNGGARDALREDGILVLGHQDNDPYVAQGLGLPVPEKGQFISVRVVPAPPLRDGRPSVEIDGRHWVIARDSEPRVVAPIIPRKRLAVRD